MEDDDVLSVMVVAFNESTGEFRVVAGSYDQALCGYVREHIRLHGDGAARKPRASRTVSATPLLDYLFTFIKGHDPRRIEYLILYLLQQTRFPPGALGLAAISAIDGTLGSRGKRAFDVTASALILPASMLPAAEGTEVSIICVSLASTPTIMAEPPAA